MHKSSRQGQICEKGSQESRRDPKGLGSEGTCAARRRWILLEVLELLQNPLRGHGSLPDAPNPKANRRRSLAGTTKRQRWNIAHRRNRQGTGDREINRRRTRNTSLVPLSLLADGGLSEKSRKEGDGKEKTTIIKRESPFKRATVTPTSRGRGNIFTHILVLI